MCAYACCVCLALSLSFNPTRTLTPAALYSQATKITDIDQLVQTFINAEDQNFSLFNYANDLSSEIENLEDGITKIRNEIKKYVSPCAHLEVATSPPPN